jgi:hypothetical protein
MDVQFGRFRSSTEPPVVTIGELDGWLRSMTTMGSVDDAVVRRVLESHREVLAERKRAELKRGLEQLGPAWGEPRTVLNEISRLVGSV